MNAAAGDRQLRGVGVILANLTRALRSRRILHPTGIQRLLLGSVGFAGSGKGKGSELGANLSGSSPVRDRRRNRNR